MILEDEIRALFESGCEGLVLAPSRKDAATGAPAAFQCTIYPTGYSRGNPKFAIRGNALAALRAALAEEVAEIEPPAPEVDIFG